MDCKWNGLEYESHGHGKFVLKRRECYFFSVTEERTFANPIH
jgi:hypothetical protein